jgi:hypothetical protein
MYIPVLIECGVGVLGVWVVIAAIVGGGITGSDQSTYSE